jgi:3-oxoacyl-[acyl-carrier protein] reductase
MLLEDKVALITGASRGIGKAIAAGYVENGAAVVLVARSAELQQTAEELRATGGRVKTVQGDIKLEATVRECANACREFGHLDIVVNNAGILEQSLLGMISLESARQLFDINILATINVTQYAVRIMKGSGSIINLASIAGTHGIVGASVYSASKAAVKGFTLAAAKELAGRGIRVNAIAPGFIDTDMTRALPSAVFERNVASIRMRRLGTPKDVANAAIFLGSDLSSYVTGQVLGVDGGMQA